MHPNVLADIAAFHDEMTDWRRDIHAHPELGFEETRTSDIVAEKLKRVRPRGPPGPRQDRRRRRRSAAATARRAIGLRADMDALPIHEETTASTTRSQHRRQDARLRP